MGSTHPGSWFVLLVFAGVGVIVEVWALRGWRQETSTRTSPDSGTGTITFLARHEGQHHLIGSALSIDHVPPPRGDYGYRGKINEQLGLGR